MRGQPGSLSMPIRDDLSEPIEGADPSGPDLKWDKVFEQIKKLVSKTTTRFLRDSGHGRRRRLTAFW